MKETRRFLFLILTAWLLLALCSAAWAETPDLFIPERSKSLRLPEMPDIPEMPEAPALSCWMDLLEETADCPKIADPDGYFHLQFDRAVDACLVDNRNVPVDKNGYGEIPAELTDMQKINITAIVGRAVYFYLTPGKLDSARAMFDDGLTVYYDKYGCATKMTLSGHTDYFRSGADSCISQITWNSVIIQTSSGSAGKKTEKKRLWYMNSVEITYPAGNYVRRAAAFYLNNKKNTLEKYRIFCEDGTIYHSN